MEAIDPVTLVVVQNGLQQVASEMDLTFERAAFSPVISEGFDRSDGIYHRDTGDVIAQGELGLPIFVGVMQFTTRAVIERGRDVVPGDIFLVNDPYCGGTHLMDVKMVKPFFYRGAHWAWLANTGHWPDTGGSVPGGFSTRATEVQQEGLRLPPVKLFRAGVMDDDILQIVLANIRVPEERIGDIKAQVAALTVGERRLTALLDRYGADTVTACIAELRRRSEQMMRAHIAKIPDGVYRGEAFVDSDGVDPDPLAIRLTVKKEGSDLHFDFSESSPPCRGPLNSVIATTKAAVYLAIKHIFPDVPINAGCFEPLKIADPHGTFLYARYPRPVSGCAAEVSSRIAESVFTALARAIPDDLFAAPAGTSGNLTLGGFDPLKERHYIMYVFSGGGYGGSAEDDGLTNGCSTIGISKTQPSEVLEQHYPILFEHYALRERSGGAGRTRGGFGVDYKVGLRRGEALLSFLMDHGRFGPPGLGGGQDGAPNEVVVERQGTTYAHRTGRRTRTSGWPRATPSTCSRRAGAATAIPSRAIPNWCAATWPAATSQPRTRGATTAWYWLATRPRSTGTPRADSGTIAGRPEPPSLVRDGGFGDALEGWHHLRGKALELLQDHRLRHAHGQANHHPLETRIPLLELLEMLDDLLGRPAQDSPGPDGVFDPRQPGVGCPGRVGHHGDLLVGQRPHEPQRPEHLQILLVVLAGLADALFAAVGDVEVKPEAEAFTEGEVAPQASVRLLPPHDHFVHGAAFGRAAAHDALDAVGGHEVDGPPGPSLNRLPALDGSPQRARDERQLPKLVPAIRNGRGQRVVLAVVREGLLVERLEDDLDLLLEQLAVRRLVGERRPERLDLAGVIPAAHPEGDPALGEDVGGGEVLRQAQGVPHGRDVEAAAEAQPPGEMGQMHRGHEHVGDALVALVLEVVLGHPEGVVAGPIHQLGDGLSLVEDGDQLVVGEPARVDRRARVADVVHVDVAGKQTVELGNHARLPLAVWIARPRRWSALPAPMPESSARGCSR